MLASGCSSPEQRLEEEQHSGSDADEGQRAGRSIGPQALLALVERIYKGFNPAQVTLDTHVDQSLARLGEGNEFDDAFVRQVVYGIVRYRQFLGSIMDSFYHYNGGTALREDMDMYKIFGYLTVFRADELGYNNLKRLVDAKEPQTMVVFFKFLFEERYLRGALRDDWLKLYDKQFVDEVIARLLAFKPEVTQLLDSLEERVYFTTRKGDSSAPGTGPLPGDTASSLHQGRTTGGGGKLASTVARPFALSQPRPKPLPMEEPPPQPPKRKPPPRRCEGLTREEVAIQEAKEANRKRMEALYARSAPFKLAASERPTNLDRVRAEIEADIARHLTFQPPKATGVPPPPSAQVKLNAAAILREDALYRKKQVEEAAQLQRYEAELRDASAFKAWQRERLEQDEAARQAAVEARRSAMQNVHELAQKARLGAQEANREVGQQLKLEMQARVEALAKEREEEVLAKQARRSEVIEARAGAAQAQERMATERRALAEEVRAKQAADAKAAAEAQLIELAEKRDLIMQLRAFEKVPRQQVTAFDPTSTPNHGLLESMSIAELRERLMTVKRHAQEEEERRRALNLNTKQEREQLLLDKAANIQRVRRVAAAQAQLRRADTKEVAAAQEQAAATRHDDAGLLLNSKLQRKQEAQAAEKAAAAAEVKRIRFEQMQQAAGAAAVEEHKFKELREGARREAATSQAMRIADAKLQRETRSKLQAVRAKVVVQRSRDQADFLQEYEQRLCGLTQQAGLDAGADAARRAARHSSVRQLDASLRHQHAASAYVPGTAAAPTLQARLHALATAHITG